MKLGWQRGFAVSFWVVLFVDEWMGMIIIHDRNPYQANQVSSRFTIASSCFSSQTKLVIAASVAILMLCQLAGSMK